MSEYLVCVTGDGFTRMEPAVYTSLRAVEKHYNINYSTLQKHMKLKDSNAFVTRDNNNEVNIVQVLKCKRVKIKGRENNFKGKRK